MLRSRVVLALVCALLLACTQELTLRERLVAEQQVEERLTTWVRLMNNADLDSLFLLYDDVDELTVLRSNGRRIRGWEEQQRALREFYGSIRYMNFVLQEHQIDVLSKSYAVTTFRHSTDIVDGEGYRLPVAAGTGTIVWVKDRQDNLWKIHLQQIAVDSPALT